MELLKYIIAVLIGGGLTLVGNYFLEDRRLKNERFKYRIDKMITVGEEYYKLSTYSLIYFSSIIDTINKREEYLSEEAHGALNKIDEEYKNQMEKVKENNIVISTASIYFDVADSEKAVSEMLRLKEAIVKQHHGNSINDYDLELEGDSEFIQVVNSMINQIKSDQLVITNKIKELLSSE